MICKEVDLLNILVAVQVPPLLDANPPPLRSNLYLPAVAVTVATVVTELESPETRMFLYTIVQVVQEPLLQYGVLLGHWELAVQVAEQIPFAQ